MMGSPSRGLRQSVRVGVALVALAAFAHTANARDKLTLEWTAPTGCPDGGAVERRVFALLGDTPAEPSSADTVLAATGQLTRESARFRLTLRLNRGDATSKRELDSENCEAAAEAAALMIAIALDPERALQATPDPPAPPAPVPSTGAPPKPPPPDTSSTPGEPATPPATPAAPARSSQKPVGLLRLGAGVGFLGDLGALPRFAPGLSARLAVQLFEYRLEPTFGLFLSLAAPDADAARGARLSLTTGGLRFCRQLAPWTTRARDGVSPSLHACVDAEFGEMAATGFGVQRPAETGAFWAGAGATVRGELELDSPLRLTLDAGLLAPLNPKEFVIRSGAGRTLVFAPAAVSARFGAGATVLF